MSKTEKILKDFVGLTQWERDSILLRLLIDKKISFSKLSELYVHYLEGEEQKKNIVINKAGLWISSNWKKSNAFVRKASAYWLLKTGVIQGAPMEAEVADYLEAHPYQEDEYGMPHTPVGRILKKYKPVPPATPSTEGRDL